MPSIGWAFSFKKDIQLLLSKSRLVQSPSILSFSLLLEFQSVNCPMKQQNSILQPIMVLGPIGVTDVFCKRRVNVRVHDRGSAMVVTMGMTMTMTMRFSYGRMRSAPCRAPPRV